MTRNFFKLKTARVSRQTREAIEQLGELPHDEEGYNSIMNMLKFPEHQGIPEDDVEHFKAEAEKVKQQMVQKNPALAEEPQARATPQQQTDPALGEQSDPEATNGVNTETIPARAKGRPGRKPDPFKRDLFGNPLPKDTKPKAIEEPGETEDPNQMKFDHALPKKQRLNLPPYSPEQTGELSEAPAGETSETPNAEQGLPQNEAPQATDDSNQNVDPKQNIRNTLMQQQPNPSGGTRRTPTPPPSPEFSEQDSESTPSTAPADANGGEVADNNKRQKVLQNLVQQQGQTPGKSKSDGSGPIRNQTAPQFIPKDDEESEAPAAQTSPIPAPVTTPNGGTVQQRPVGPRQKTYQDGDVVDRNKRQKAMQTLVQQQGKATPQTPPAAAAPASGQITQDGLLSQINSLPFASQQKVWQALMQKMTQMANSSAPVQQQQKTPGDASGAFASKKRVFKLV